MELSLPLSVSLFFCAPSLIYRVKFHPKMSPDFFLSGLDNSFYLSCNFNQRIFQGSKNIYLMLLAHNGPLKISQKIFINEVSLGKKLQKEA